MWKIGARRCELARVTYIYIHIRETGERRFLVIGLATLARRRDNCWILLELFWGDVFDF